MAPQMRAHHLGLFGIIGFFWIFSFSSGYADDPIPVSSSAGQSHSETSEMKKGPSLVSFAPQGVVSELKQVQAVFSDAMISFGDMQNPLSPFDVSCPISGKGRWSDPKNWVYDFDASFPPRTLCRFKLKKGLKTEDGRDVLESPEFSVGTGGPRMLEQRPYPDSIVTEDQVFVITLDSPVTQDWLESHAYFVVDIIQEKIPAIIVKAPEAQKYIQAAYQGSPSYRDAQPTEFKAVLKPKRTLPYDLSVILVLEDTDIQKASYRVRKEFSASFTCSRERSDTACIPFSDFELHFTEEVPMADLKKVRLLNEKGTTIQPDLDNNGQAGSEPTSNRVHWKGPFPEKSRFKLEVPKNLKDDSGRQLVNRDHFPLEISTDPLPPLAKFSSKFGILEKDSSVLPVTVRKIDEDGRIRGRILKVPNPKDAKTLSEWFLKVNSSENGEKRGTSILNSSELSLSTQSLDIPRGQNKELTEVIGIPLKDPGLYVVELESQVLGRKFLAQEKPMFVSSLALVTDLSIHFKKGMETSAVWVTELSTGRPVENASVQVLNCKGEVLAEGQTDHQGTLKIGELPKGLPNCNPTDYAEGYSSYATGFYVTAEKSGDFSFLHSDWKDGIEAWRFNLNYDYWSYPNIAHTVFDRTLLRAGQTLHLKSFIRRHGEQGLTFVSKQDQPETLKIEHLGSSQSFEFPVNWKANGTTELEWNIPKEAKLGHYRVLLQKKKNEDTISQSAGEFRVEAFKIPLLKASLQFPKDILIQATDVPVDFSVDYLNGGPASLLPVQFRYNQSKVSSLTFHKYENVIFSNGKVASDSESEQTKEDKDYHTSKVQLSKAGSGRVILKELKKLNTPSEVNIELEFRDPNGETQTKSEKLSIYTSESLIGVLAPKIKKNTGKQLVTWTAQVINLKQEPVTNVPVEFKFFKRVYLSHRKKLIGGFYAYEHRTENLPLDKTCVKQTNEKGLAECEIEFTESGNIYAEAKVADSKGKTDFAHNSVYLYQSEPVWFKQNDDDRIDLVSERKNYEVGERAVFQVQMPFKEATAWVTVEREGVLDSFVFPVSSVKPTIEIPILKNYAPNVFVSALVVRGRIGETQPTAFVDLGKPSFKLGISEILVGYKDKELKVSVSPEKTTYQVREKAKVRIHVEPSIGAKKLENAEVIVAAVDEGLLQLADNKSWDLLQAMLQRRPYEVSTMTAQMQVVGKRHFGLKAVPAGGGGGLLPTRELSDSLLFWKTNVLLNKKGDAIVEIPLNDSITSFKIVAIASNGASQFGFGSNTIRAIQDLSIIPGVPGLVRTGDEFNAEFTFRNSRNDDLNVTASLKIRGSSQILENKKIHLTAGESQVVSWKVVVPLQANDLTFEIQGRDDKLPLVRDHLKVIQKVIPAIPVQTYQATLFQVSSNGEKKIPVEMPKAGLPDRGGLRVRLIPSLVSGLSGVQEYMREYPYTCLEQKLSKAIVSGDEASWDSLMKEMPVYLDEEGLAKYFPSHHLKGSDALTSYILSISNEADEKIPEETKAKMLRGLLSFVSGGVKRNQALISSDLELRKVAALEALARNQDSLKSGERLTLIQVAQGLGRPSTSWTNSHLLHWLETLSRLKEFPGQPEKVKEAETLLRGRLNNQGSQLSLQSGKRSGLEWLMISTDLEQNRFVLSLLHSKTWQNQAEDLPRALQGALAQLSHGRWSTTPANAWGSVALEQFAKKVESGSQEGMTEVILGSAKQTLNWLKNNQGKTFEFPWFSNSETLEVKNSGNGSPWVIAESRAAIPLKQEIKNGFSIKKSWLPVEKKIPTQWSKGDIVRIRLELEASNETPWVVVGDPIPAGASILGTGLGNDSSMLTEGEKREGWVWPIYEERHFEAFRSYYERVPAGKWTVEYTIRLNQSGVMNQSPTRVEAMYAPEIFSETPNEPIRIED